jgi:ATP-dependent DNA helicase RecQ
MPSGADIERALREHFGFAGFRPGQRELVEAALAGRDALGILPTGGGKSLTYQLPATLIEGLTVVVSPLIALMKDQVDAFNRRRLGRAVAIHSNLPPGLARAAFDEARSGAAKLLYLAPERLLIADWRFRLRGAAPRLLVIDEAHCVSQWGYDFRPAYLALREVVELVRPCAVLALTATATPPVRDDVIRQLGLRDPFVFVAPFDRPNLSFEVVPCEPDDKLGRLVEILRADGAGSQIVYVGRRRDAEEIAGDLLASGLGAVAYHAGLTAEERQRAQDDWLSGRRPIVVATVAFGMGIDKPDVRTVVHWQHPSSLEAYYQEAGRAGRDGGPARCLILFSERDVDLHEYFIAQRYPSPEDVKDLLRQIPRDGVAAEDVGSLGEGLTAEQRHVAVLALSDEGVIARDEGGSIRRVERVGPGRRLALAGMRARRRGDEARLEAIVAYCRSRRCQRRRLLEYFGERLPDDYRCDNCSACRPRRRAPARHDPAARTLDVVRVALPRLAEHGPVTARRLGQFLRGRRTLRVPAEWPAVPGFGLLRRLPRDEAERLARDSLQALEAESAAHVETAVDDVPTSAGTTRAPVSPEQPIGDRTAGARRFTPDELAARPVPRKVGLAILRLVAASEGVLAASGIANVLRGARSSDAVLAHPELADSPLFGSARDREYEELFADTLAMHAKGFLASAPRSKRFALGESGRQVLARASPR